MKTNEGLSKKKRLQKYLQEVEALGRKQEEIQEDQPYLFLSFLSFFSFTLYIVVWQSYIKDQPLVFTKTIKSYKKQWGHHTEGGKLQGS